MKESEIKFSLEDIRKMLEKFKGAILYPVAIENIVDDFKEDFLEHLKIDVDIHNMKIDGTMANVEISQEFIDLHEEEKEEEDKVT